MVQSDFDDGVEPILPNDQFGEKSSFLVVKEKVDRDWFGYLSDHST